MKRGKLLWDGHKETVLVSFLGSEVKLDELYSLAQFYHSLKAAPEYFGHCFPSSDSFDIKNAFLLKREGLVEVYEEAQMGLHGQCCFIHLQPLAKYP